jgi:hypothetical protein
MPAELAANAAKPAANAKAPQMETLRQAPLKAQTPNGDEVEVGEAFGRAVESSAPSLCLQH